MTDLKIKKIVKLNELENTTEKSVINITNVKDVIKLKKKPSQKNKELIKPQKDEINTDQSGNRQLNHSNHRIVRIRSPLTCMAVMKLITVPIKNILKYTFCFMVFNKKKRSRKILKSVQI
ncbi:hypothetical protein NUSPORA_00275 [Nucleospora cyclopteri]